MLRAMSPDVLATDELGGAMDMQAVTDAARAGVSVLATLHGRDEHALDGMQTLLRQGVFDRFAVLGAHRAGEVERVLGARLEEV